MADAAANVSVASEELEAALPCRRRAYVEQVADIADLPVETVQRVLDARDMISTISTQCYWCANVNEKLWCTDCVTWFRASAVARDRKACNKAG